MAGQGTGWISYLMILRTGGDPVSGVLYLGSLPHSTLYVWCRGRAVVGVHIFLLQNITYFYTFLVRLSRGRTF